MVRGAWLLLSALACLAVAGCRPFPITVHAESAPPQRSAGLRAALRLRDVTAASGVQFRHHTGAFGRKWFPETSRKPASIP